MKTTERVALIYGLSVLGAGAVSLYRGRSGSELFVDAAMHGVVAGTALNVGVWLAGESGLSLPSLPSVAQLNDGLEGVGKLSSEGKKLLSQLDTDTLYASMKSNGVKIAPVPENPSIVNQDMD